MTVGIGTGSTAAYAIAALGERVARERIHVRAVPTSVRSRELAEALHIPLVDLSEVGELDLTIDGADEVDPALHLIKGGGGALLREKIVANASRERIIICDDSKLKPFLGAHPLPVAVVPFGYEATHRGLRRFCEQAVLRTGERPDEPFVTDDGCYIFDLHMGHILDPPLLEQHLKHLIGVVEVGLFIGMTTRLVVGFADGHTEEHTPDSPQRLDVV